MRVQIHDLRVQIHKLEHWIMSLARVRKSKAPVEAIKPRVPGSKYWVSRATKSYIFMAYFYGKQDFKATIIIPLMWEYLWTGMAPESK